jgi:hypothetical protein
MGPVELAFGACQQDILRLAKVIPEPTVVEFGRQVLN